MPRRVTDLRPTKPADSLAGRLQDLIWLTSEAEDRIIVAAPALVAEARARRDEHESIAKAYGLTRKAWRRHDKATQRHHLTLARHGVGSDATGKTLARLLAVRHDLLNTVGELAFELNPDWIMPGRSETKGMARARAALAAGFGPRPEAPVLPGSWARAKEGLGLEHAGEHS